MKRIITAFGILFLLLFAAGCEDPYAEKLDEIQNRIFDLEDALDKLNSNLASLQALVKVIQNQDMITGITEIKSGSTVQGYKINFVKHSSVTITNGQDGLKPLVSSRQDPDDGNYYWSVQYGDGTTEWLLAPDGSRMLSIGLLPYVTIRDNKFYYTVDGVNWLELGKANGEDADQMFKSIDIQYEYVVFHLSNGENLKIPTYASYLALKEAFETANDNVEAQVRLIEAAIDRLVYINSLKPIMSGTDTVGLSIGLSNGKSFRIHDWTAKLTPSIFMKKDSDGKYYWAYSIGDAPVQWLLSTEGNKVPAISDIVEVPLVSVTRDTDGQYYWTVTVGGKSEYLRYPVGDGWAPHPIDSVKRAFQDVRNYGDSLVVQVDEATRFVLPKQFSVKLTDASGGTVDNAIKMREVAGGDEAVLPYTIYGTKASVSILAQGGFSVTQEAIDDRTGLLRIKAPEKFVNGQGKFIAVFTFPADSPVSAVKTITITK